MRNLCYPSLTYSVRFVLHCSLVDLTMRLILTLSTFLSLTFAHSPSESSNSTVTNSASPSLQTITVGKGGTSKFDPESLAVPPGSKVVFEFYPGHNSVVQGSFDKPCSPSSNLAFYSGYVDSDSGPAVSLNPQLSPGGYYSLTPSK